jgi:hypothetical protein
MVVGTSLPVIDRLSTWFKIVEADSQIGPVALFFASLGQK